MNEKQRQELRQILDIQDRLQRTAAEMNALRFTANACLDIETLSQQLSQMPADLSGRPPHVSRHISPVPHRAKRIRSGISQMDRVSPPEFPLNENVNFTNCVQIERAGTEIRSSITQEEEDDGTRKKTLQSCHETGELIFEDHEFSQFEVEFYSVQ